MNGDRQERNFTNTLVVLDWEGVRAPSSGSAPRDQPDVLMGKAGTVLVAEVKSGERPANLAPHEVEAIETLAEAFGGAACIAIRYKGDRAFYLVRPDSLARTESGNYAVPDQKKDLPRHVVVDEASGTYHDPYDTWATLAEWADATARKQLPGRDGWNDPR